MKQRKRRVEIYLKKVTYNKNGIRIMSERVPRPAQFVEIK